MLHSFLAIDGCQLHGRRLHYTCCIVEETGAMSKHLTSRRQFLALASAGAAVPLVGCSDTPKEAYGEAAALLRARLTDNPEISEFVRYATLAANGHNSQPWRFAVHGSGVSILPDLLRRTPAVDPDDHHLYASLGCAAENFLIASQAHGQPGELVFESGVGNRLHIDLASGPERAGELYDAIPQRQSTRSDFNGRPVSAADLEQLEIAANTEGVNIQFITAKEDMEGLLDYVVAGNSAQVDDPDFVEELKHSIRFNADEALQTGDGLFTACSGNPTMPGWIGRLMFGMFYTKDAENDKYASQVRSSAGIAVFTGDREGEESWVNVGRSFQRFALQATALGIRHSHINQPVEVPAVRAEFARWLGIGSARPDLVIRFGYAPPLPMSMRRPVSSILTASA